MEADMKPSIVLLLSLALLSCNQVEAPLADLAKVEKNLAFTCKHEIIPAPPAETELLFDYARWLQKDNQLSSDPLIYAEVERLYRIAAGSRHFKASINLQNGGLRGLFRVSGEEYLRLSQQLITSGVATGNYLVGVFLEHGAAGLEKNTEMSLRYFRKAADEGSSQAQFHLGNKLAPVDIAPYVAEQMRSCAAQQLHGEAARKLAVHFSIEERYQEAVNAFQMGVAAGDEISASFLEHGYLGPEPDDKFNYLAQSKDVERANRYQITGRVLSNYSYANPKVPEINDIVPLPPAKLPQWDGKLQWLEAYLANVPPEKPTEALIVRLAQAKGLDPATGKPLPGSLAFSQADLHPRRSYTGELCLVSGYWTAFEFLSKSAVDRPTARYSGSGKVMLPLLIRNYNLQGSG